MTGQLYLIAQQRIADMHNTAEKARLSRITARRGQDRGRGTVTELIRAAIGAVPAWSQLASHRS